MGPTETQVVYFPSWCVSYQSNGKRHFCPFLCLPLMGPFLESFSENTTVWPGCFFLLCHPSLTVQSHWLLSQSSYFLPQGLCMSLWLGFLPCTLLPAFFLNSNSFFRFDLLEFLKYSSFLGHSYSLHICDYLIAVYFPQRKEAPCLCLLSLIPRASSNFWHTITLSLQLNLWMSGWMEAVVITTCNPVNEWISLP